MGIKFLQNIDAERNKFEEAGFEVVNSLPIRDLFPGRQVFYNGQEYTYNGRLWTSQLDPEQKFIDNGASITSDIEDLNDRSQEFLLWNSEVLQIPTLLSGGSYSSLFDHIISIDDALIERQDTNSETWTSQNSFNTTLTLGQKLRITAWRHDVKGLAIKRPEMVKSIFIPHNARRGEERVTIEYLVWTNATGDDNVENASNYTWWKVYEKELSSRSYWIFPLQRNLYYEPRSGAVILNVRITIEVTRVEQAIAPNSMITGFYIFTSKEVRTNTTPVYLNYDAIIQPTQTAKTYKTVQWILQYLTQGVNWLRNNYLPLTGGTLSGDLEAPKFVKTGGTNTQALMADGSVKDVSEFASSSDIPDVLPNPNSLTIKTADGVAAVNYDGSRSGGVNLAAGDNMELTATQDSDDTMTVKFGAVVPQKLPNPQALQIQVVDDINAQLGSDILYDGLTAKILKLVAGYGIELNSVNLTGGQAVGINLKQIAGTTLLGNANGTTGTPQAITMAQLRTMLGSLTLNDIDVTLGDNSSYTLPCYIDYNGTRYQCRISKDATGLQIYRNGAWVTIGKFCRCSTRGTITNSNIDNWYNDTVPNYELDDSVSADLYGKNLTGKFGTSIAGKWTGKTVTLNLASVSIKDTKSAWETLKKNMGDCFPSDSVEKIRYYYNVAIPSGEVKTRIEMSYKGDVGVVTTTFYTEG